MDEALERISPPFFAKVIKVTIFEMKKIYSRHPEVGHSPPLLRNSASSFLSKQKANKSSTQYILSFKERNLVAFRTPSRKEKYPFQ